MKIQPLGSCPAFLVNLIKYTKYTPYHLIDDIYCSEWNNG